MRARAVFAADKAGIAEAIERSKNFGKIHLALVRLAATGDGGDLDMAASGVIGYCP